MKLHHLLRSLICLMMAGGAAAQSGSIQGVVIDQSDRDAIPFVFLKLVSQTTNLAVDSLQADFDGNYRFNNLPGDSYNLLASFPGYPNYIQKGIFLSPGQHLRLDLEIAPNTSEAIIVEYRRPLIEAGSGTVLGSSDIVIMGTRNIGGITSSAVGVHQEDEGNAISANGGRWVSDDVYIDGIRVFGNMPKTAPLQKTNTRVARQSRPDKNREKILYENYVEASPPPLVEKTPWKENVPIEARLEAFSTFSIDVDNASYVQLRAKINRGELPTPAEVRIEEMLNYFAYDYPQPQAGTPFELHTELSDCPWNAKAKLLLVGLQGNATAPYPAELDSDTAANFAAKQRRKALEQQADTERSNLVFLVDVSGSMSGTPLNLVKQTLKDMVLQMRDEDRAALVVYAGRTALVVPSTPGSNKQVLLDSLQALSTAGSTAGASAIQMSYDILRKNYIKGADNRIILATDGDFNVGISNVDELEKLIEKERQSAYIFLSVFGVGNVYNDAIMERLANKGNGMYFFIDDGQEAQRIAAKRSSYTTIAKDVKLQLEFNPQAVQFYRLVGYENRMLAKKDFDDDKKDAGELGKGHTVTALYELVLTPQAQADKDTLMNLRLRSKHPLSDVSQLVERPVLYAPKAADQVSSDMAWASTVAGWGMLLRQSRYRGNLTGESLLERAKACAGTKSERKNAVELMEKWWELSQKTVSK